MTFKLGAKGSLPPVQWRPTVAFNPPEQTASDAKIREGFALYQDICLGCHGLNAVSGLLIPDLRGSALLHQPDAWRQVVLDGAFKARGMPAMNEHLDQEEADAIRAYVVQQAWRGKGLAAQSTP